MPVRPAAWGRRCGTNSQAERLRRDAADHGADEPGQVVVERVERVRRHELLPLDEAREEGALGRHDELAEQRLDDRDGVDERELRLRLDGEQREQEGGVGDVRDDEDAPPVPAVDENARKRPEEDPRHDRGEEHPSRGEGRPREVVHDERQADERDPAPRHRDEPAEPQAAEVAAAQEGRDQAGPG